MKRRHGITVLSNISDTGGVGDSTTLLYMNEGLIRLAKVGVIARGHLTGLLLCGFCFSASMT